MFHLQIELSVTRNLVTSFLVSAENSKLVKIYGQINSLICLSHQKINKPNFPKYAITSDLSRHAKSSLTATTGVIPSIKVAIKGFPILRSISASDYPFRYLRLTSDSSQ